VGNAMHLMQKILKARLPLALVVLMVAGLVLLGRGWWCSCESWRLWSFDVQSRHNSQHIVDWYTFSHITHGFIFYALLQALLPRLSFLSRLSSAVALEGLWELLENSPIIIERYRAVTMALDYYGDSIANSCADVGFCSLGFLFAARVPWRVTLAVAIAFELFTLFMIRDNLTLNVLMLLWPLEFIRVWQAAI
jgi:hypothetical protein